MQETQIQNNWLSEELKQTQQNTTGGFDKFPALKLEEGKITEIIIDASKPFEKYNAENSGKKTIKAIIPVTHKGEKKTFWCNVKNPIYGKLIAKLKDGQNTFKIVQTGTQANTKYNLVE